MKKKQKKKKDRRRRRKRRRKRSKKIKNDGNVQCWDVRVDVSEQLSYFMPVSRRPQQWWVCAAAAALMYERSETVLRLAAAGPKRSPSTSIFPFQFLRIKIYLLRFRLKSPWSPCCRAGLRKPPKAHDLSPPWTSRLLSGFSGTRAPYVMSRLRRRFPAFPGVPVHFPSKSPLWKVS